MALKTEFFNRIPPEAAARVVGASEYTVVDELAIKVRPRLKEFEVEK